MAWNKNTLISTHTVTEAMRDAVLAQGPRGYEFMFAVSGGQKAIADQTGLFPIDSGLAEYLLGRGPRSVQMAKYITGYIPV